jgi:hypothetical protein
MSHPQPSSTRVLSPASGDFVKDVANSNVKEEPDASPARAPGTTEPPLPLTPERLELIKAYAASRSRGADEAGASRIAKRFAPRGSAEPHFTQTPPAAPASTQTPPAAPASTQTRPATAPLPVTSGVLAWASGIRRLTAVLVIAALLPNIALAIYWLRLIDTPSSEATLPPKNSAQLKPEPEILSPVLSIPDTLEASAGTTIAVPIALDGTDAVPERSVIVIKGLPPGSALSAGSASGEAEWKLKPGEIGDLQLHLGDAASGDSRLSVELVAPGNGTIATTSTTLQTKAAVKTEPFPYGIGQAGIEQGLVPNQALVPDIEAAKPEAGAQEGTPQETASIDAMSLPDRRPEPPADANWIRPTAWVNLREGPSSTAKVLKIVAKGVKLRVLGRKRGWVQVEDPSTSQNGWIYARNVASVR